MEAELDDTISLSLPPANRLGNYVLIRELGCGGFGVVYEAQHGQHGNRVALKTLPTGVPGQVSLDHANRLHNFRREYRSLVDVNHPNLVGLNTLEVDGGTGTDFRSSVIRIGLVCGRRDVVRSTSRQATV